MTTYVYKSPGEYGGMATTYIEKQEIITFMRGREGFKAPEFTDDQLVEQFVAINDAMPLEDTQSYHLHQQAADVIQSLIDIHRGIYPKAGLEEIENLIADLRG